MRTAQAILHEGTVSSSMGCYFRSMKNSWVAHLHLRHMSFTSEASPLPSPQAGFTLLIRCHSYETVKQEILPEARAWMEARVKEKEKEGHPI